MLIINRSYPYLQWVWVAADSNGTITTQSPAAMCLATANVELISIKRGTHFFVCFYRAPFGNIPLYGVSLHGFLCSMTKPLPPRRWIWITNTVCTYIYETRLILLPQAHREEVCQSQKGEAILVIADLGQRKQACKMAFSTLHCFGMF